MKLSSLSEEKLIDHALAGDEQLRRDQLLLHEKLSEQNRDLREAHMKSLNEIDELKRFQGSTFDEFSRRRSIENQNTILTAKIHELQNETNCMNDSRDFQDAESVRSGLSHVTSQPAFFPPFRDPGGMLKPFTILRKSSDMQKPIQRVKFTKAIARHTKIRDQNPSLGYICPGEPHERSPNSPKFEDRSQEETEWQEQGAREAAWKLAKSVLKLKEHQRAAFFSPSENRCLPASTLKPEEREFVVDSGASMHMISKQDLSDAEMDTLTKSCSPTIVITANGEVQTHEEAKDLEKFLTMKVLEDTPAVLTLGKLCDEHGYSYESITGPKPHLTKNGIRIQCNTENFVPIVVPGLSTSSSSSLPSSTSMTPSRQEIDHPTSSSSSSTSPTMTFYLCQAKVWQDKKGDSCVG